MISDSNHLDLSTNCAIQSRQCSLGVLDTRDDPAMRFDEAGVCHYYQDYLAQYQERVTSPEVQKSRLARLLADIQKVSSGKRYDTLIGLSGGVDSTYVALLAKRMGLRPLCVHFDNGWNSEMAVQNIENIVGRLGFDLYTYVINWYEFRDLQLSYLKASVVDIEVITDHAIFASLYRMARQHGIKHILSGTNVVTEAVLPPHWIYNKVDHVNIKAIHAAYGSRPLKTYPFMDLRVKKIYQMLLGIRSSSLLDLVDYHKARTKEEITRELGWRDYGGKHYESIWTRFYQGHILPHKFGVDKRKAHLTNLIYSGQITKADALAELALPLYEPAQLREDLQFVLKKLGLSAYEWEELMAQPARPHTDFATERSVYAAYPWLRPLKPLADLTRGILGR
jgi:N-acetyl sugar amidotransferase